MRKRLFLWISKVLGFSGIYKDAQAARNLRSLMASDSYYIGTHNDVSKLFYRYSNVLNIIDENGDTTVDKMPSHVFFKNLENEANKKTAVLIDKAPTRTTATRRRRRGGRNRNHNQNDQ